jgi:hypothetical protein
MLGYFPLSPTNHLANGGISVVDLPAYFKDFPPLEESASYLLGWLQGYMMADAHENTLYSSRRECLEFAQLVCARLGLFTGTLRMRTRSGYGGDAPLYALWIDLRGEVPGLRRRWHVVSVRETEDMEHVYCPTVPTTGSFVLEDGLLTGNCPVCADHLASTGSYGPTGSLADASQRYLGSVLKPVGGIKLPGTTGMDWITAPGASTGVAGTTTATPPQDSPWASFLAGYAQAMGTAPTGPGQVLGEAAPATGTTTTTTTPAPTDTGTTAEPAPVPPVDPGTQAPPPAPEPAPAPQPAGMTGTVRAE